MSKIERSKITETVNAAIDYSAVCQIIGRYVPVLRGIGFGDEAPIRRDLSRIISEALKLNTSLADYNREASFQLRRPPHNQIHSDPEKWHSDCGFGPRYCVLWATEQPTEILFPTGYVYRPEPYDIVLINNTKIRHRRPKLTFPNTRWFAVSRIHVSALPFAWAQAIGDQTTFRDRISQTA